MKRTVNLLEVKFQILEQNNDGGYSTSEIHTIEMPKISMPNVKRKLEDRYGNVVIIDIIEKKLKFEMDLETFVKYAEVVEE